MKRIDSLEPGAVGRARRAFGRRAATLLAAPVAGRVAAAIVAPALVLAGCNRETGSPGAPTGAGGASTGRAAARPSFNSTDITGADYGRKLELVDQDGKPRTLEDFRGKVTLVFFGFTQCPDVCPTALSKAAAVKQQLGEDGKDMQVVFVTLDPERDTPDVIGAYVKAFDPTFIGLRGDLAQTQAAAREFRVFYQKVPNKDGSSYTIDHTAASYVFDPEGRLRLFVKHSQDPKEVADDIRQLIG